MSDMNSDSSSSSSSSSSSIDQGIPTPRNNNKCTATIPTCAPPDTDVGATHRHLHRIAVAAVVAATALRNDTQARVWQETERISTDDSQTVDAKQQQQQQHVMPTTPHVSTNPPSEQVPRTTASTAGTCEAEKKFSGVIPIGVFRDPQGNAWQATLEHPGYIASLKFKQIVNQQREMRLQQQQQQQHMPLQKKKQQVPPEIIDLQSDDSDDNNETSQDTRTNGASGDDANGQIKAKLLPTQFIPQSGTFSAQQPNNLILQNSSGSHADFNPPSSMPSPKVMLAASGLNVVDKPETTTWGGIRSQPLTHPSFSKATTRKPARLFQTVAHPTSIGAAPTTTKTTSEQSRQALKNPLSEEATTTAQPHAKRKRIDASNSDKAATRIAPSLTAGDGRQSARQTVMMSQGLEGKNKNESEASAATDPKLKQSFMHTSYGPYVDRWLTIGPRPQERDLDVKASIETVLMAATGYTSSTVPKSLPFPPAEVALDRRQLEEVAQELVSSKYFAIREAVRNTFTEMKASQDGALLALCFTKEEIRAENEKLQQRRTMCQEEILRMKNQHEVMLESMKQRIMCLQDQLQKANEVPITPSAAHSKALETIMRASILSLRMLRKAKRREL